MGLALYGRLVLFAVASAEHQARALVDVPGHLGKQRPQVAVLHGKAPGADIAKSRVEQTQQTVGRHIDAVVKVEFVALVVQAGDVVEGFSTG